MKTLIHGGLLIDPANRVCARLNLLMENGRITAVTPDTPAADRVVDAAGKVVCPGFVDIHMHEDPLGPDGKIYADPQRSIFHCMLRMGVSVAVTAAKIPAIRRTIWIWWTGTVRRCM